MLPFLAFIVGLAGVFLQRDVVSRDAYFHFALLLTVLGAIPLVIRFFVLMLEITHLPPKYWMKLFLHRLLMNILGDHGPAANFVSKLTTKLVSEMTAYVKCYGASNAYVSTLFHHKLLLRASIVLGHVVGLLSTLTHVGIGMAAWYLAYNRSGELALRLNIVFIITMITADYWLDGFIFLAWIFEAVAFDDAFSRKYQTRSVSLAVWLEDEPNIQHFYDCRGRKLISKWEYPYIAEVAIPMILQDLDCKRLELLKRLKSPPAPSSPTSFEHGESSEQGRIRIDRMIEREENLRWAEVRKINWKQVFEREQALRWRALSGTELTQDLFQLENIKLQLKHLELELELEQAQGPGLTQLPEQAQSREQVQEPEQAQGQELEAFPQERVRLDDSETCEVSDQVNNFEHSDESDRHEWPLNLAFLEHLRERELAAQQRQEEWERREQQQEGPWLEQQLKELRERQEARPTHGRPFWQIWWKRYVDWSQKRSRMKMRLRRHWMWDVVSNVALVSLLLSQLANSVLLREAQMVKAGLVLLLALALLLPCLRRVLTLRLNVDEEGETQRLLDEEAGSVWLRWNPDELKSQRPNIIRELQRLQSLARDKASDLQGKELIVKKVIRSMRLEVIFSPNHRSEQMTYAITATANQETYFSNLYFEEFRGYCDTSRAAQFFGLMEILDDDTFVVKRQEDNPLLLQVNTFFNLGPREFVLPCESLEEIIKCVLQDGKQLDAVHVGGASYV